MVMVPGTTAIPMTTDTGTVVTGVVAIMVRSVARVIGDEREQQGESL